MKMNRTKKEIKSQIVKNQNWAWTNKRLPEKNIKTYIRAFTTFISLNTNVEKQKIKIIVFIEKR